MALRLWFCSSSIAITEKCSEKTKWPMTEDKYWVPVQYTEFLCEYLFRPRPKLLCLPPFWLLHRNRPSYWTIAIGGLSNSPIAVAVGLFFSSGSNSAIATWCRHDKIDQNLFASALGLSKELRECCCLRQKSKFGENSFISLNNVWNIRVNSI